jgi:hypothetical protein
MTSGLSDVCVEFRTGNPFEILVRDGDNEIWLPRSMIEIDGEERRGQVITVTLPLGLAIEKGLV